MLTLYTSLIHYLEPYLSWPTHLSEEMTTVLLIFVFGVLSTLELHAPKLQQPREQRAKSYQTNLGMFAFNSIVVSILSVSSILILNESHSGNGPLSSLANPVLKAALSFLALDLFLYLWHKFCHNFDSLWMFHKVHHNDPYLNVSTAFRIHLVEVIMTTTLKTIYVLSFGIDKKIVLAYETLYTLSVMFHHTNIAFRGEKLLGYLFITPSLHRSHHSRERREHDSNYGAIFSIWDRLLRTLKTVEPAAIGIKGDSPQTFLGLLKFGFNTQRPAVNTASTSGVCVDIDSMIAEAAYYKAEKRSFSPGHELYDWLEAKKEVCRQVCGDNCGHG